MSDSAVNQAERDDSGAVSAGDGGATPSGSRKAWIIVAAVIVGIAVVGGAGWALVSNSHPKNGGNQTKKTVMAKDLNNVQSQAETAANKTTGGASTNGADSNVAAGLKVYDQAISNATDNATRGSLDMQAATLADNDNQYDTALSYALKADALLHTDSSTGLVASIYVQKSDMADAITYYKKAATEVNTKLPGGNPSQYYLLKAQALEEGKGQ